VVTTPGWDDEAVPVEHVGIVAAPGSPSLSRCLCK
jgi:hypothetical protein